MTSKDASRILVLEEQVKSLAEELMQCQAHKEFVWSLWKRLQVANPDLTQAVSLVVEREKHKAEIKDRKVLEILQVKDYRIQELEQKVAGQQQELINLVQKRTGVDEEGSLMKTELTTLQEQLNCKSKELQEMKIEYRKKEEEQQQVVWALEEEREGLSSRCVTLLADLEEKQRQNSILQGQRDSAQARVKDLEVELHNACQELFRIQAQCSSVAANLSAKEREAAANEDQLIQLRCKLAEVQTLYKHSTEHAAEQSHLIKQLEGLNLDTQRVLRNQEEAHTADTTSCQRLYNELSLCHQTLVSSEAKLRQNYQEQSGQLAQKDQQIAQLQAQLQEQERQLQLQEEHAQHSTSYPLPNKQTNLKGATLQQSKTLSSLNTEELICESNQNAQKKIQDLEELLQLKTAENKELRKAYEKRRERLVLIQRNYATVREQLKEMEKPNGLPGGQGTKPWLLSQENSEAVWNELAYLKNLSRKFTIEKASLEEELDILRVQAAADRATAKELQLCLANEHQELLHKVVEEHQVKSSTPKKASVSWERMEQSFKKIEQLERRMMSLEEETERLREEKEQLLEANEDLAQNSRRLQASVDQLRTQEAVREEAAQAQALAQWEQHSTEVMALEARLAASQKASTKLHRQLLKLRQELGILRAARDFYRNRAAGPSRASGIANNISSKAKFKTIRPRGLLHQHSHPTVSPNQAIIWQGRSPSPTKDEWEDMSVNSDSDEAYSDSLNCALSRTVTQGQKNNRKFYRCELITETADAAAASRRNQCDRMAQDDKQHERWEQGTRGKRRKRMRIQAQQCSSSSLQHRVESLQRHIDILRSAKKDAVLSARELRRANEKIITQLNSLTENLCSSKQLTQKLTTDLAGVEQQKKVLEMELEQWRQIRLPPQPAPTAPVNTDKIMTNLDNPASQALEAEVKQLQTKLKSASVEVTRQVAANKALRGQLQEKEDKLRQLQDKANHTERDLNMKRQLVDDMKTRLKVLQEMEKSYRSQVDDLEKKVKALSEEATNRKAFIESLKRRLSVANAEKSQYEASCEQLKEDLERKVKSSSEEATSKKALIESLKRRLSVANTEKGQYEASCTKLNEDLEKKKQQIHILQTKVGAGEEALEELKRTTTERFEGLTEQSSQTLERLRSQLLHSHSQLDQLHSFIRDLASEILLDVQEVKQHLMKRRRLKQANAVAAKGTISAKSMIKAKSIAASILNMSENDLANLLDTDQGTHTCSRSLGNQEWLQHLNHLLQQKIPSADQLMEAVRVKMKERKVLTEELATLATPVSENA